MKTILILAAAAASAPQNDASADGAEILVTASREEVPAETAPVSASVFGREEIEALALPLASDILRLVPGVAVAASGPKGTYTELRIRGAEANHSLLFVDGIRFNDPATSNQVRFEHFTSDALSRVELVRGPQSALWGSEALGGVVAIETADPLIAQGFGGLAEYGSLDSARAGGQFSTRIGNMGLGGSAGWITSDGIDSFGGGGERDGFENRNASGKVAFSPASNIKLGIVAHWIESESEYDGFDPMTFRRADTLDETRVRTIAGRAWASAEIGAWSLKGDASILDSANRNRLDDAPINATFGRRFAAGGQLTRTFGAHRLTAAVDREEEDFRARDQIYGGATAQERERSLTGFVAQWRSEWRPELVTDLAIRHDAFSDFKDVTTFRAAALIRPIDGWSVHAAYGEGIAQPTFYDLFGFFPGSFRGNPALKPESSKGWEAGLRWEGSRGGLGATAFTNRLEDEIVDTFDFVTFLSSTENVAGKSRRRGFELDGDYRLGPVTLRANYTYLDAAERRAASDRPIREVRRPKHSANLAATGSAGSFSWGGSLSYVGSRTDQDFDLFPARTVRLGDYLLASLKLGWAVTESLEAYVRAENALDSEYQDVVGYNTAGRTVYAGLRFRLGR